MLRVDVVINLFPRGIAFALDIFSKILATVFCFIMLKAAYNVMYTAYDIQQASPAMQMPIWILYSSAPLGFLLAGVRGIQGIILSFIEYRKNPQGVDKTSEAEEYLAEAKKQEGGEK